MTRKRSSDTARRLALGLNGDADQRAATMLLTDAAHGIWLDKLAGWPEYIASIEDPRRPDGLCLDWHQLREDLAADDRAWVAFNDWAESRSGRLASDAEYEARMAELVPGKPWHGASSSELVLLRIALELAPGGLLGDGLARLDPDNLAAVVAAFSALADGRRAGLLGRDSGDRCEDPPRVSTGCPACATTLRQSQITKMSGDVP